jgi:RHS repeat-associated protein
VKLNGILQADYDYDAASRLIKTTFGNNTEEVRIYDTLNRLKELTSKRTTDNVLLSKYVYTLDKVGNRKTATETVNGQSRSLAYTYDDLYRLTDEVITDATNGNRTSGYAYDAVGNRRSKTINGVKTSYAYDANDRMLNEKVNGATTVSYSYDNNGSTLTKTENGITTTYTWNDEKRLVSVTVGNTQQVEYTYNDQGIRVSSKVNGVETRYLLDEGITANVWEEYSPNGSVQASYVYGRDLITQTQGTQTSYYLVDGLGSTRLLTDTQGQVLNSYGYEAFGEKINQSGSTDNKYQYAGEQFDAVLGDYYLRQRFYDTSSGRFGRMDTYEGSRTQPSTLNKYIYTSGNPINGVDPTGYFEFSISGLTMAQKVGLILVTIGIGGVLASSSGRKGEHIDQPLEGFDLGRPPTILENILRWRDSWRIPPLPGFGDGPTVAISSHTGHTGKSINNLVQYVFNTNRYNDSDGFTTENTTDADADALAQRIGGQPRLSFNSDPVSREFDAISDEYIAQAKPAGFTLNKTFRDQAKATFEAASATNRKVLYEFGGPPGPGVIKKLNEYSTRYNVPVDVLIK